jgi:transposase, IS6 family
MFRNWSGACAGTSSRRTTRGGWRDVRAGGCTCTGAVDSSGATINFLLSAKRGAAAAERLSGQSLGKCKPSTPSGHQHRQVCRLPAGDCTTQRRGYSGGELENCQHRTVQYLNNVLEQDHRAIKRRIVGALCLHDLRPTKNTVNASQHFRSFWCGWRTIAGYEATHMIRKGQAYGSARGAERSTAPLHSRSVRGYELNYRSSTPTFGS